MRREEDERTKKETVEYGPWELTKKRQRRGRDSGKGRQVPVTAVT